jgi:hypothetical protein
MLAEKKGFLLLLMAMVIVVLHANADDAHSKTLSVVGKARVITPISLENTDAQGLDFGTIVLGTLTSRVKVTSTATVQANVPLGDAVVLSSVPQKAAKFTVSGEAGKAYAITLPASTTLLSGLNVLTVDNFSCSNDTGGSIGTDDLFYVGAQLLLPAGTEAADYVGTFSVTVSYN